jgi:hypothetical protein
MVIGVPQDATADVVTSVVPDATDACTRISWNPAIGIVNRPLLPVARVTRLELATIPHLGLLVGSVACNTTQAASGPHRPWMMKAFRFAPVLAIWIPTDLANLEGIVAIVVRDVVTVVVGITRS